MANPSGSTVVDLAMADLHHLLMLTYELLLLNAN